MLPPGHYQQTRKPLRVRGRERWLVAVGTVLAALVIGVTLFSLTSHQAKNGRGCLDFTYAMVMGGEELHACGGQAKKLCTSPPKLGGLAHDFEVRLRVACRQAKIGPVPAASGPAA